MHFQPIPTRMYQLGHLPSVTIPPPTATPPKHPYLQHPRQQPHLHLHSILPHHLPTPRHLFSSLIQCHNTYRIAQCRSQNRASSRTHELPAEIQPSPSRASRRASVDSIKRGKAKGSASREPPAAATSDSESGYRRDVGVFVDFVACTCGGIQHSARCTSPECCIPPHIRATESILIRFSQRF